MLDETLLYDLSDSPFCLKARICLQLKGVPFRRVTVTLGRRAELRRLNPLGKVPVLVLDGHVVADSSRIARHLEARDPEPALIPVGAEARAYAALLEEWADEALYPIVGAFKWLAPENRAAALANTVTEMTIAPLRPLVGRLVARAIRRRLGAWGYRVGALPECRERMAAHLGMLATLLEGKPYLLGRTATLADVAVFAQLAWMQRYAEGRLVERVPVVRDWLARIGAVPAVAAALAS
ncbi:MAG TPA: glutathione S-transferase family protein [Candidatus Binatia bacterium]|nr:glutathione S-transferase family protein [Candidatus Binatia bacterium]